MKRSFYHIILLASLLASCEFNGPRPGVIPNEKKLPDQFIVVLGITQDAGYPQAGCEKLCCKAYWEGREEKKYITCLALVDRKSNQYWLFEATPDIAAQLHSVQSYLKNDHEYNPRGVFLTHAHIGHYSGLMYFGREAIGSDKMPVWAMPRMDSFLRNNGPWSQLVSLNNIELKSLKADSAVSVGTSFKITPLLVPHRDEYSETAGFVIESSKKKLLFIPDIDKWEKWNRDITKEIIKVDAAFIDATFYNNGELPNRDMNEVPHPFVEESLKKFSSLPALEKSKIIFIHFNHTNPLVKKSSREKEQLFGSGFRVAEEGMVIEL